MKFRYTGDEHKPEMFVAAFQIAEESLEYCFVMLFQIRIVDQIKQRLVVFIDKNDTAPSGLLMRLHQQIRKALFQRFVLGITV